MIKWRTFFRQFCFSSFSIAHVQFRRIMTSPKQTVSNKKQITLSLHPRRAVQTIQVGGHRIQGLSIAAVETCICFPSLSLAFDIGRCPPEAISMKYVAITHGHCDHVHGLPLHLATRSLQRLPTPKYFMSSKLQPGVKNLIDAVAILENSTFQTDIHTINHCDEPVEFKKGWLLKPFITYHTVASQGYIIYKKKKRLRSDLVGLSRLELIQLRKAGVEVDEYITTPEIAFTGDTTLDAIENCDDCRNARILITEMTFIDNKSTVANAREYGHIHLEEVIDRSNLFERNEHVIFTHFSARHSSNDILDAMQRLPGYLRQKSVAFGIT